MGYTDKKYDVVKEGAWTTVPKGAPLRAEAPKAHVYSYELEESQLRAFVSGYLNITDGGAANDNADKFYEGMYKTKPDTIVEYIFPFFGDNFRSFNNNYADTFSQISQRGAQFLGADMLEKGAGIAEEIIGGGAALAHQTGINKIQQMFDKGSSYVESGVNKVFGDAFGSGYEFKVPRSNNPAEFPGTYIETPKFFQYANTDSGIEINFILSNTIEKGDIGQNQKLIKNIMLEARPERESSIAMSFPRIYKIKVPGLRFIRWAYLANAAFNLVGSRRIVKETGLYTGTPEQVAAGRQGDDQSKIVPEGYAVSLTFNSLTIESANFIEKADM